MAYDGFYLTYKNDRETNDRFDRVSGDYPNFKLVKINLEDMSNPKIVDAVMKIASLVNTKHFWVIDPEVVPGDDFDFSYTATEYDEMYTQLWNADERDMFKQVVGVKLFNRLDVLNKGREYVEDAYYMRGEFKLHEKTLTYSPTKETYDIFYWKRNFGNENLKKLKARHDNINIVMGENIMQVHEKCRAAARTDFYYLVYPDTDVNEDFDFSYNFEFGLDKENQKVALWQKVNPVTGYAREYHGIGLFPTQRDMFDETAYKKFYFKKDGVYDVHPASKDIPFEQHRVGRIAEMDAMLVHSVDTEMFWMIDEQVEPYQDLIDEFYPFSYDRDKIHNFNVKLPNGKIVRNGVRLIPKNYDMDLQKDMDMVMGEMQPFDIVHGRSVEECISKSKTHRFWMVNPDLDTVQDINKLIDEIGVPDLYDMDSTQIWSFADIKGERVGYGGLALSSKAYNKYNLLLKDDIMMKIPEVTRIKVIKTRDPYQAYVQAEGETFYWVVDTIVELLDDFKFDYYPDIFNIENVFAFANESTNETTTGTSGVYLVHRPHLSTYELSERDFSFDRFKNMIFIDKPASKTVGYPVFYFDEGLYKENTDYYKQYDFVEIIDATDVGAAYLKAAELAPMGYFWAIDNDVKVKDMNFDRSFYIDKFHKSHFHMWPKENPYTGFVHQFGGLKLVPAEAIKELKPDADKIRKMNFKNKRPVRAKTPPSADIPYDVVFLSYNEPFADANYEKLLQRVPNAKRVHGVKGIFNAHKQAAELADTRMFYVVDADAILLDEFNIEYMPTIWDEDIVHTWKSKNPINDLIYGYGGLKLFPTKLLREATDWHIDFTTSISEKFKPMPTAANYTAFNTDPFNTWKSAFRECTKLASSIIQRSKVEENKERLDIWCNVGSDRPFGEDAINGARDGRKFGIANADNPDELSKINDFEWLKATFEEKYNGK